MLVSTGLVSDPETSPGSETSPVQATENCAVARLESSHCLQAAALMQASSGGLSQGGNSHRGQTGKSASLLYTSDYICICLLRLSWAP